MKPLLQVIVGSAVPEYFDNCLSSVALHSRHDVLAFYNFIDERDLANVQALKLDVKHPQMKIRFRPNQARQRTGSLYSAYNEAIELGLGRYRAISFIQADMQMMWWDDRIIDVCEEMQEISRETNPGKLSFYTQIPVAGKRPDFYGNWRDDSDGLLRTKPGAVDVGIYPLDGIFGSGLRFSGSEKEFSTESARQGVSVMLHPYPFLAPIPFPRTARDVRSARPKKRPDSVKLRIAPGMEDKVDFGKLSFHPLYMEDIIWPDGWRCLTPYWPSDTKNDNWFRLRRIIARDAKTGFLRAQGPDGPEWVPRGAFRPGAKVVIGSASKFLVRAIALRTRNLFLRVGKKHASLLTSKLELRLQKIRDFAKLGPRTNQEAKRTK